jgi:hypothetical protein
MQPLRRIGAGVLAAAILLLTIGASPVGAGLDRPPSTADDQTVLDEDERCNDISGSPLCVGWFRDANYNGTVWVEYYKTSGPTRHVRLYVASCGQPKVLVYEGDVSAGRRVTGGWNGRVSPGACWVGYMRIGNQQWTTGELYS